MASRKHLKKDIDYLVTGLIADCYLCIQERPDQDLSEIEDIINNAVDLKEQLLFRVNHVDEVQGSNRPLYRTIKQDLLNGLHASYEKLRGVIE
ncbi:MAG: hypothetical protein J7L89_06015 [Bacteroidales bacterium]|nr:hypothetical protein [Bacteroidales bacterium]